jgi:hypothetical protein
MSELYNNKVVLLCFNFNYLSLSLSLSRSLCVFMAESFTVKVLEHCYVFPPPNSAPETSLPLTFFDIPWLFFSPGQPLFFYEYPYPTSFFTSTTLPNLKHSLSLALQHYYPFAGNLLLPSQPAKPELVYTHGDKVGLTFAESGGDFSHLSGR